MDSATLWQLQAPLKERYRHESDSAIVTLSAIGELDGTGVACRVRTARALVEAGLHPAAGGDGTQLCSGDMLLEALVGCAGVTLRAVATAIALAVRGGSVRARTANFVSAPLQMSPEDGKGLNCFSICRSARARLEIASELT